MSRFVELGEGDNFDIDLSEIQAVVFPVEGEEVTIEPTTEEQVILPTSDKKLIGKATVKAVTSEIDANIKPENILLGKTILGVQGNVAPDKPDQTKTTIPTKERQVVRADVGYELAESIVEPIPDEYINPQGEIELVENGTYNVREVETAKVNVPMPSGEILIDENNKTYNVKDYETARVEIAEKPKGEFFVKVFDYDGTLLDEKWLNNGETYELTVTPPIHDRLTFSEWVCTQDMIDGVVTIDDNNVLIGASYTPTSGLDEIEIELTPANAPNIETDGFTVTFSGDAPFPRYWDYGNDTETSDTFQSHTYYKHGKYIIAFASHYYLGSSPIFGQSTSNLNNYIKSFRSASRALGGEFRYCGELETVSLSPSAILSAYALQYCYRLKCVVSKRALETAVLTSDYNLKTLIFTNLTSTIPSGLAQQLYNLEDFVIPKGVTTIGDSAIQSGFTTNYYVPEGVNKIGGETFANYFIEKVKLPTTLTTVGNSTFINARRLKEIVGLEDTKINTIPSYFVGRCYKLKKISFPSTTTTIVSHACSECFSLEVLDFSRVEQIPALENVSAFNKLSTNSKFVVPDALYDEWIVATNWVNFASQIYKASEVEL